MIFNQNSHSFAFKFKIEDKPVFDFSETTEISTFLMVVPIIPLSSFYTCSSFCEYGFRDIRIIPTYLVVSHPSSPLNPLFFVMLRQGRDLLPVSIGYICIVSATRIHGDDHSFLCIFVIYSSGKLNNYLL